MTSINLIYCFQRSSKNVRKCDKRRRSDTRVGETHIGWVTETFIVNPILSMSRWEWAIYFRHNMTHERDKICIVAKSYPSYFHITLLTLEFQFNFPLIKQTLSSVHVHSFAAKVSYSSKLYPYILKCYYALPYHNKGKLQAVSLLPLIAVFKSMLIRTKGLIQYSTWDLLLLPCSCFKSIVFLM